MPSSDSCIKVGGDEGTILQGAGCDGIARRGTGGAASFISPVVVSVVLLFCQTEQTGHASCPPWTSVVPHGCGWMCRNLPRMGALAARVLPGAAATGLRAVQAALRLDRGLNFHVGQRCAELIKILHNAIPKRPQSCLLLPLTFQAREVMREQESKGVAPNRPAQEQIRGKSSWLRVEIAGERWHSFAFRDC